MRRALAMLVVAAVLAVLPVAPAGAGDPVKDRQAAQARANAAAARLAKATSSLARVEDELKALEQQAAATEERLAGLEVQVREVAVNSYVHGTAGSMFVFDSDLGRTARRQAMARWVSLGNTAAIDDYRAARQDLETGVAAVRDQVDQRKGAAAALRKEKSAAYSELSRLAAIEKQHLARLAGEREAAARRAAVQRTASRTAAPAPRGNAGRATGVIATGEWICPVQGPHSFSNDWGQPRSGGRRHQGNDMLSPRGTPVVASVAGVVKHHNSRLGGLSYWLKGVDGHTYFGTHLSSFAAGGNVAAGTVVGYVGDSGNARGTPHLHFEIHPNGGGAVNPYATLRQYC